MEDLMNAIFARWTAAGLHTSIALLYPAGEKPSAGQNKSGSPTGSALPRAEYFVSRGAPQSKTRNSRIYQAVATIRVRGTSIGQVTTFLDAISAAFINSEEATGTTPLSMENGDMLDVDDGGGWSGKADDTTFECEQTLLLRHRVNNRNPT